MRPWLLAILIVAATVGAMLQLAPTESSAAGPVDAATSAADVVEVAPLIPRGRFAEASWRGDDMQATSVEPEPDSYEGYFRGESSLDVFGEEAERRRRHDEKLRETVQPIEGLGLYVAQPDKDREEQR